MRNVTEHATVTPRLLLAVMQIPAYAPVRMGGVGKPVPRTSTNVWKAVSFVPRTHSVST